MKTIAYFLLILTLSSCASKKITHENTEQNNQSVAKEMPRTEVKVLETNLASGLKQLQSRNVAVLFIYNMPDSYLIKAKSKINPPDYAIHEVMNIQSDRAEWMNETLVTHCDECKNFQSMIPLQVLPEDALLKLIDRASLKQDPTKADFEMIHQNVKEADVFWVIFGSEEYEQKRGQTGDQNVSSAVAENTVTLRSFIYDTKNNRFLNKATVTGYDDDLILYEKQVEKEGLVLKRAPLLMNKMKSKLIHMPVGPSYDGFKYDDIYPYPPVPENGLIIKKSLSALAEILSP